MERETIVSLSTSVRVHPDKFLTLNLSMCCVLWFSI